MKKSTMWVLVVAIVVLLGIAWYAFSINGTPATDEQQATSTTSGVTAVNYYCASGTIDAAYSTGTVTLAISDGRSLTLPQGISGSGVRYETASGTIPDIAFLTKGNNAFLTEGGKTTYDNCVAGTETPSTAGMTTYTDGSGLFSFMHPTQFSVSGGDLGYSQNWRSGTTSNGLELAVVTIPSSFQPKTNFGDAKFTFGTSVDPDAIKSCLTDANGSKATVSTTTINGVAFTELSYSDAGAGNIYQITSYRTVHNGQCYAAEYVVHSTQLANYPASAGITAFNSSTVNNVLDGIAHSVMFLQ